MWLNFNGMHSLNRWLENRKEAILVEEADNKIAHKK